MRLGGVAGGRSRRALFGVAVLIGATVAAVGVNPAGAEIDSVKQTSWGTQTKGASGAVAGWDALTWAIDQIGNTIYVGGNFLEVTNGNLVGDQPYFAAFDADTGDWQSWFRPQVGNTVLAMEVSPDGGLFVGGEIDDWNGETIGAFNKIDPTTGETWPGWTVRAYGGTSAVRDIKLEADGWLYVVGSFDTVSKGGVPETASNAFRVDPITGTIDPTWRPILTGGGAWGVARSQTNGLTYIAGRFTAVNGDTTSKGFVGVDDTGSVVVNRDVVPYNGCQTSNYCSRLYDVETTEFGTIWVGGVEHALYVLDETSNYDMMLHHYTACSPSINGTCEPSNWYGGEFQELERIGDRMYATCHCWYDHWSDTTVIGHTQPHGEHSTIDSVAAYDPATGERIDSFRPFLTGDAGGFAIHGNPSDGCLWLGGGFDAYGPPGGPQPAARDLVRICDEAGAGPPAVPDAVPPAPVTCDVALAGPTATVTWANTTGIVSAVIERQLDGGNWYWRGKVDDPGTTFSEDVPADSLTVYRVKFKYLAGQFSTETVCDPPIDFSPDLQPPTVCSAVVTGSDAVLTWDAGNDAVSYVVHRTVDGGNRYWRGKVDAPGLTFTDPLFTGSTFQYDVVAKGSNGAVTSPTSCTPPVELDAPELDPVASCSGSVVGNDAVVTWDASTNAASYIVYRTVDGGNRYWRGKVDAPGLIFTDPLFTGSTFQYDVVVKGADGSTTPATLCNPPLDLVPDIVDPPSDCSATVVGSDAVLTWTPSPDTGTTIIYRTPTGGPSYWRGRVDDFGTTFTDPLGTSSYGYEVLAQMPDGTRSDRVGCGPPVQQ